MRILMINPNTSMEMTKTIDSTAKKYASPGTEITTVNPEEGPDHLSNLYDYAMQAPKVMELIEKNKEDYDFFVIACAADPGLEACRLITPYVIGIGEAAYLTACAVAKRFSVIYELKQGEPVIRERIRRFGIDQSRCVSVKVIGRGDGEIVKRRDEMFDSYYQAGKECVEEDGAGALVLSCAGMADLKERLEKQLKVPAFSGVESAVKIAEQLSALFIE